LTSVGDNLGAAKRHQSRAAESAAEQQQARNVLPLKQEECLGEFPTRSGMLAGAAREQTEMKPRHCEARVEINGDLVLLDGALPITGALPAQCEKIVGAAIQFIEAE
jgi:hypothetical protein